MAQARVVAPEAERSASGGGVGGGLGRGWGHGGGLGQKKEGMLEKEYSAIGPR